jgi:hypothetical protein
VPTGLPYLPVPWTPCPSPCQENEVGNALSFHLTDQKAATIQIYAQQAMFCVTFFEVHTCRLCKNMLGSITWKDMQLHESEPYHASKNAFVKACFISSPFLMLLSWRA